MDISIAKEVSLNENRVALTPAAVRTLVRFGHNVNIETNAGVAAGFTDEMFSNVGAKIVFSKDEAFKRCKLLLKIFPPSLEEFQLLTENQIVFSYLYLAAAREEGINILRECGITAIGMEIIEDDHGQLPVLTSQSELAGQMAIPIASYYLSNVGGGRGILLGGAAGVPPATVTILGAGTVGINAARTARGIGCNVILIDSSLDRLRYANDLFCRQIVTYLPNRFNLEKILPFSDVVIGAVLIHGEITPKLVTEDIVKTMKPGAVVLDVAIDHGGCFETSHPTNWVSPTYKLHGVTHFCVPNMPSDVGRTATYALVNATLPYIASIANNGLEKAINVDPGLARGVYTFHGKVTNASISKRFKFEHTPLYELIGGGQE
ncbi:MAG TPA: alanine dehydrogenase [candidate division Zixibacteria bacterium]|nr:alanine dehydrogenase [candidate division Zixibacteria bacterium]